MRVIRLLIILIIYSTEKNNRKPQACMVRTNKIHQKKSVIHLMISYNQNANHILCGSLINIQIPDLNQRSKVTTAGAGLNLWKPNKETYVLPWHASFIASNPGLHWHWLIGTTHSPSVVQ